MDAAAADLGESGGSLQNAERHLAAGVIAGRGAGIATPPTWEKDMTRILLALLAGAFTASAHAEGPPVKVTGGAYTTDIGLPLYFSDKDAAGKSNCDRACLDKWAPLLATSKARSEGAWTVIQRDDGIPMWAYKGKPVYRFSGEKAGEKRGDGVDNVWHVLKP